MLIPCSLLLVNGEISAASAMNFLIIMAALVDASLTTVSLTVYVDGVLAMAVDDMAHAILVCGHFIRGCFRKLCCSAD